MTDPGPTDAATPASVVLLSGGLDSATALAHELAAGVDVAAAVQVDYGQRHIREQASAVKVADHLGVELVMLDLRGYGAHVASALTTPGAAVPHGHYAADNMASTVVPNRNATMLSAAAGIAASLGAGRVVTAVHAGDHPIYADCRPEFIEALSAATLLGCGVAIAAPFVQWSKEEIAARAIALGVPIADTWSCYEGGEIHCGQCGTCVERAEALALAGAAAGWTDPTRYGDPEFWKQATGA